MNFQKFNILMVAFLFSEKDDKLNVSDVRIFMYIYIAISINPLINFV